MAARSEKGLEDMAKNALIVGPPRSGTSLASSIFARVGYHVGSIRAANYRLGDDHNPFGYFEADEVVEHNARLLRRVGYRFHNTWTFEPISASEEAQFAVLEADDQDRELVRGYEDHAPWLWKDPRMCLTLPYWWRFMDPDRTVVYLTTRDPVDAYASFRRKGWCRSGAGERRRVGRLVEHHIESARQTVASLNIPHIRVHYTDYSTDPEGVAERISEAFEIDVSSADLNFRPELDHSGLRGTISTPIRQGLKLLPRKPVERVARLVPRPLLRVLFPERLHSPESRPDGEKQQATS